MVSLCSKSYIIEDFNGKQKMSRKGVSKNLSNPMRNCEETLKTKYTKTSPNHRFRINGSDMFACSQDNIGFNYFYCKRGVLPDGVTTKPLAIV